jgi:hypothetical protein
MATTTKPDDPVEAPESEPVEAREASRRALTKVADDEPDNRTIHERMVAILGELPAIGKDQENTQQNFHFRGHDDILNALNPLLAKHGVFIVPNVLERVVALRTTGNNKSMYEVNLHVEFTFYGLDGSSIVATTWGEGTDMGDKATNKAMTMAFKNVLNQSFSISSEEFTDADSESPEPTTAGGRPDPDAAKKRNRRQRIGQLLAKLDEKTKSEKGTWGKLVDQEVQRLFGVPYADLSVEELEDVGKTLRVRLDSANADVPDQLEFVVPF